MSKKEFYFQEMMEQPFLFKSLFQRENKTIKNIVQKLYEKKINRIIFTGCGDAFDNAVYSAQCVNYLGHEEISAIAIEPFEFIHQNISAYDNDAIVVFSVKGRSKLVLQMLEKIQKRIYVISVTNVVNSPIATMSDDIIYLNAGEWIGPRTKVYTLSLYVGLLLAVALNGNKCLWKKLGNLFSSVDQILNYNLDWNDIVECCNEKNGISFIEYGMNWSTAYMGRAKVKEVLRWDADIYELEEFAHTATVAPSKGRFTIFCCEESVLLSRISEIVQLAKTNLEREVLVICNQAVWNKMQVSGISCKRILVPEVMREAEPILQSIVLQMLIYYIARQNGIHPDYPPLRQLSRETAFIENRKGEKKNVSTESQTLQLDLSAPTSL